MCVHRHAGTPQGYVAPYASRPNGCDVPYAGAAADWQPYGAGDTVGLVLQSERVGSRWRVFAFKNGQYCGLMFSSGETPAGWSFEHSQLRFFVEVKRRGSVAVRRFGHAVAVAAAEIATEHERQREEWALQLASSE
jgi:hypothetical protein